MKKIINKTAATLVLLAIFFMRSDSIQAQAPKVGVSVNFQVFYDNLSPYGRWVNYPNTGYVWIPRASVGFKPYSTNGHWVNTEVGWSWVSDYPWGWAAFHYGRWNFEPQYGWMWIPANVWSVSWVTWRRSPGYYGWVPMGYRRDNDRYNDRWDFVRDRDFGRPDVSNHYVNRSNNVTIIKNSTTINNTVIDKSRNVTYNAGPNRADVEKKSGKKFTPVAIKENDKPSQKVVRNKLDLYRPQVQETNKDGKKGAPKKVTELQKIKSPEQKAKQPAKKDNGKKKPAGKPPKK